MAFFRTGGGGGIPAALKAAMNAVLNKKFGTAKTYEPNDWPNDVNLMGALEEKTASGAIAHIEDGADRVPLKNWLVTLPASLDGYTAIHGKRSWKNLSSVSEYPSNPWDFWGTNFTDMVSFLNTLKTGTYAISFDFEVETVPDSGDIQYGLPYIRALVGGSYVNLTSYTISTASSVSVGDIFHVSASFTLTDEQVGNIANCYLYCDRKDTHSGSTGRGRYNLINVQIEVGSTATAYEAYEAPTQYTASLGRTIYGGQADIVSGQGIDNGKKIKLNAFTWEYVTGEFSYGYFVRSGNISDMTENKNFQATGYINNGNPRNLLADGEIGVYNNANAVRRPVIRDDSCTSLEQFLTKIADYDFVYECTTETDFTFTPITAETALGVNNFWANEGDSDVTYRSSGTVTTVVPTLITKSITENGTYSAENDDADGYSSVTVAVQSAICERLMYARCVNNDVEEIPAISTIEQGTNYASYLSYDSSTKKFTVLQNFTGVVVAWVYAYRAYDINRPDGIFYLNNTQMLSYETTANAEGSTGGRSGIYNFKQGDTFWVYTPTRHGYPQQNLKVYLVSDLNDDIFTFADEAE